MDLGLDSEHDLQPVAGDLPLVNQLDAIKQHGMCVHGRSKSVPCMEGAVDPLC